jgi:hypothetical protein
MNPDKPDEGLSHDTDFAAMWSSDGATRSFSPTATGAGLPTDLPFLFAPGQRFGPYLIVRPLGKGGMGQVYEAEETESGRRIAMKILSRGLGDDEERERFLREGQLAASLSHPNTVYVFGTTEVQGFPVIAMELAPGGTLKDLVVDGTALAPAAAVDAILQVVAGLDAAAGLGILHRDIKPSNCFVDRDGRVLVGDFGLSMTTLARDEQTLAVAGTIMGTPGFASPEQLRGGTLDVRSDIYSVGATLYYLLTGRPPFDDTSIVTLITRVANEAPPVVTAFRPDVPPRLASVVARCLSRTAGERYANYPALAAALEPFRSAALTPASPGRRFMAGVLDTYTSGLPMMPLNLYLGSRLVDIASRGEAALLALPGFAGAVLYYTIFEGRFGCGAGKAVFNLRVVDGARGAPGYRRAFLRALVFMAPSQILTLALSYLFMRWTAATGARSGNLTLSVMGLGTLLVELVCFAVLFSTIRRANGYAAIHDRVTGTRVVLRPKAIAARQKVRGATVQPRAIAGDARLGPYVVAAELKAKVPSVATALTVDAYDDRLRRGVWMELLPLGTPPLPAQRRDLSRPTRARWLSGRRTATECWDAYEAVDGQGFLQAIAHAQPWARVRHWLADLGREVADGLKDGSLPPLQADRLWIGSDDRARLLDWPPPPPSPAAGRASAGQAAPGTNPEPRTPNLDPRSSILDLRAAEHFLYGVATGALRGVRPDLAGRELPVTPVPVPARALLLSLREGTFATPETLDAATSATLRDPAALPRHRRLLQLAVCSLLPITMAVAVFSGMTLMARSQTADPASFQLRVCLGQLVNLDRKDPAKLTPKDLEQRDALEIYIAEHLRAAAEEKAGYARAFPAFTSAQRDYRVSARALANHPQRSPEQVRKADALVAKLIASNSQSMSQMTRPVVLWGVVASIAAGSSAVVAILGLIGALLLRGGFTMRAFGAALVGSDGRDASRLRVLWRAVVAWSPLVLLYPIFKFTPKIPDTTVALALLYSTVPALLLAGAVWAWTHPSRGIQDRIAGTWIVPR